VFQKKKKEDYRIKDRHELCEVLHEIQESACTAKPWMLRVGFVVDREAGTIIFARL